MAALEWLWWPLPAWLGSGLSWFVALNVVVGAIAALSSRAQPPSPSPSPRRGGNIRRRASSAALNRVRSFSWLSIFSSPSSCFSTWPEPDAAATFQETEEPAHTPRRSPPSAPRVAPTAAEPAPAAEEDPVEESGGEGSMSMEEVYALVLAGKQRPPPTEEEVRRSEVDAKAEEFIQEFKDKEDLRQQRLDSIFNYTQMLKRRAAAGRRPPVATADTNHT